MACDSCTDRAAKKDFFCVRMMVDSMMVTNFFSCQPLPSGTLLRRGGYGIVALI